MNKQNLILIGFMGAGKTSVGRKLAELCRRPLEDTDHLIEKKQQMTISQIFAEHGEAAFRQMETEVLEELKAKEAGVILSSGGGLPLRVQNRALLKEAGLVIYLRTSPDTVLKRLAHDTSRPLLQGEHVQEKVHQMMKEREDCYLDACHEVVETDGKTIGEIAEEIQDLLYRKEEGL